MIRKLLLLFIVLGSVSLSKAQSVYEWYQDGIVVFQMKTDASYNFPVNGKMVDFNRVPFIAQLKDQYGVTQMKQLHPNDSDEKLRNTFQIRFEMWAQVEDVIKAIQKNPQIEYAEKKELHRRTLTPNDLGGNSTNGTGMWHLYMMQAQQAWDLSTGNSNVVVAVTDDAILTTHVDLQNKLVMPYDAVDNDTDPNPCGSNNGNHGTHVAGTVGAETNNNTGVSSIGFNVSIMPVKIGNCSDVLTNGYDGINYAANNGADVINMSWGGLGISTYGQNILDAAWDNGNGSILVAAAGNDDTDVMFYPAAYNNVVAVSSTTNNDSKSGFSNYGTWVDISAPGSAIRSTYAGSNTDYARIQGTSMASPNVAGLVGLMKSYAPGATNQDLINCLLSSADDISSQNSGYIGELGSGRINAYAALQCVGAFNLPLDAGISAIVVPGPSVCGSTFTPEVQLRNYGTSALTSVDITYEWNGTPAVYNWTGNLTQGQSEVVTLPAQTGSNGSYTFTASTSNPNGGTDLTPSNDESQQAFTVDVNGQQIDFFLSLDCYAEEIDWRIEDGSGTTLFSGGGYTNSGTAQIINETFCLPVGCYDFIITDSFGDGMFGSQYNGCSIDGDYNITDGNGNVLVQMTAANANFGTSATHNFCVLTPNPVNDAGISSISPPAPACAGGIEAEVELTNFGSDPLTSTTINFNTGGATQNFAWTGNLAQGQSANVTLPAVTSSPGSITYTAYTTDPNGTTDDNPFNDEETQSMNVFVSPATPVISQSGNSLSVTLGSGETAEWSLGGSSAGTGATITMSGSGTYEVVVANAAGCESSTSGFFESQASISEIALVNSLLIFPNPTNGSVNVNFQAQEELQMWVTDAVGRKVSNVRSYKQGTHEEVLDLSSYRSGIYMIVFESANGTFTRRVTKR